MTNIILLGISLFVMAVLVLVRYAEMRRRKNIISQSLREKCDACVLSFWHFVDGQRKRFWNLCIEVRKYITHLISHAIVHSWEFLVKKSAKYINMVRGKGILKNRGSISFFQDLMKK